MSKEPFIDRVLRLWSELQPSLSDVIKSSRVLVSEDDQKAGIEIIGVYQLALVEIWNHLQCLDVSVMPLTEKTVTIMSVGPCTGVEQARERLQALCDALMADAEV